MRPKPWIDPLRKDEQPPADTLEAPAIDVLFFDPEHLLVHTHLEFCAFVRCETAQEADLMWLCNGEQVFARYLHWKKSQPPQRVSAKTVEATRQALQLYLRGGSSSEAIPQSTRKR
jgi:hypothetical protein